MQRGLLRRIKYVAVVVMMMVLCSFSMEEFDRTIERGYDAEDAGRFDEAISIYNEVLKSVPEDSVIIRSDLHSNLLICHLRIGQLQLALEHGEECLRLDEQLGDKERISSSLSNLASLFMSADRLDDAEAYLQRSIKLERELNDGEKLAIRLGMLCEVYTKMKLPERAVPLGQEALELDRKGGRENKAAIRMSQLGNALVCLHRSQEAMPYLTEALRLHRKYQNLPSENITLVTLGMAEHDLGHRSEAERYLKECIALSEKMGQLQTLVTANHELAKIYMETNDPRALSHMEQYMTLKDSLTSQQVQKQISAIEVKYEVFQKEQELEKRGLIIRQQRMLYVGLGIMLVLALGIVFFLARTVRLKNLNIQLRNRFMQIISHDLKNPALAQQQSLHVLAKSADNIDPETLRQMVGCMAEDSDAYVNLLYSLLDWAGMQTGRLKFTPIELDLCIVVREVLTQHRSQAEIKNVTLTLDIDDDSHIAFADKQMTTAMIRNLLSNAIKFSYAGGEVKVGIHGTKVEIENGQGFGKESDGKGTGLGLNLVEKLATTNGVRLEVDTKSEKFTVVSLLFNEK